MRWCQATQFHLSLSSPVSFPLQPSTFLSLHTPVIVPLLHTAITSHYFHRLKTSHSYHYTLPSLVYHFTLLSQVCRFTRPSLRTTFTDLRLHTPITFKLSSYHTIISYYLIIFSKYNRPELLLYTELEWSHSFHKQFYTLTILLSL